MAVELDERLDEAFVKLNTGEDGYRRLTAVLVRPEKDSNLLSAGSHHR